MPDDTLTPRQRRALRLQRFVQGRLGRQERDWQAIGRHLEAFDKDELYSEMDFTSMAEWAESIGISRSMAYDLVEIQRSPYRESLQGLGISKARLVLPLLKRLDADGIQTMLDDVAELTWHDTRQIIHGDDPILRIFNVRCPSCGKTLQASKSVTLEVYNGQ